MKSIIINLQEDLTDEQIDKLIEDLKSRKKQKPREAKAVITFTKQEKDLFAEIEKATYTSKGYFCRSVYDYDTYEDFVMGVSRYIKKELDRHVETAENEIWECKDEIKINKQAIAGLNKLMFNKKQNLEIAKKLVKDAKKLEKSLKAKKI